MFAKVSIAALFLGTIVPLFGFAQSDSLAKKIIRLPKPKPIANEIALGYQINSDGWGIAFHKSKIKEDSDPLRKNGFVIELAEKKHPGENREQSSLNLGGSEQLRLKYVYGKINNFYQLKAGYRFTYAITQNIEKASIPMHLFVDAGISAGFVKPYYLKILRSSVLVDQPYSDSTKDIWLNRNYIGGASGFKKGFSGISIVPGALLKSGIQFEYVPEKFYGLQFEVGGELNAFTQSVQILAESFYKPVRASMFISAKLVSKSVDKKE